MSIPESDVEKRKSDQPNPNTIPLGRNRLDPTLNAARDQRFRCGISVPLRGAANDPGLTDIARACPIYRSGATAGGPLLRPVFR